MLASASPITKRLKTVSNAGDEKPESSSVAGKECVSGTKEGNTTNKNNRLQSKIRAVTSIEKYSLA